MPHSDPRARMHAPSARAEVAGHGDSSRTRAAAPGPEPDRMAPADWIRLAALHRTCLPDSASTLLGARYAERLYRYLSRSGREHTFMHRDREGLIDAACVLSLDPRSLNRRLWRFTPVLRSLWRAAPEGGRWALAKAFSPSPGARRYRGDEGHSRSIDAPEVILLFVAPQKRRRGRGRALIERARAHLRALGYRSCFARTRDAPRNPAAAFYLASGFELRGRSRRRGFQVWESRV